jgi:hypothetical protein
VILIPAAFVIGVIAGLIAGGSFRQLGQATFRWWPLAIVGFGLQLVPVTAALGSARHGVSLALLFVSYALLLVFVAVNIGQRGFPIVAVGFALNALVITANAGMPVTVHALRVAAGPDYARDVQHLQEDGGAKHHLQRSGDLLLPLSDTIGLGRPFNAIFSVGDLFWLVGTAWVVAGAMIGPRYRGRHVRTRAAEVRHGDATQRSDAGVLDPRPGPAAGERGVPGVPLPEGSALTPPAPVPTTNGQERVKPTVSRAPEGPNSDGVLAPSFAGAEAAPAVPEADP